VLPSDQAQARTTPASTAAAPRPALATTCFCRGCC